MRGRGGGKYRPPSQRRGRPLPPRGRGGRYLPPRGSRYGEPGYGPPDERMAGEIEDSRFPPPPPGGRFDRRRGSIPRDASMDSSFRCLATSGGEPEMDMNARQKSASVSNLKKWFSFGSDRVSKKDSREAPPLRSLPSGYSSPPGAAITGQPLNTRKRSQSLTRIRSERPRVASHDPSQRATRTDSVNDVNEREYHGAASPAVPDASAEFGDPDVGYDIHVETSKRMKVPPKKNRMTSQKSSKGRLLIGGSSQRKKEVGSDLDHPTLRRRRSYENMIEEFISDSDDADRLITNRLNKVKKFRSSTDLLKSLEASEAKMNPSLHNSGRAFRTVSVYEMSTSQEVKTGRRTVSHSRTKSTEELLIIPQSDEEDAMTNGTVGFSKQGRNVKPASSVKRTSPGSVKPPKRRPVPSRNDWQDAYDNHRGSAAAAKPKLDLQNRHSMLAEDVEREPDALKSPKVAAYLPLTRSKSTSNVNFRQPKPHSKKNEPKNASKNWMGFGASGKMSRTLSGTNLTRGARPEDTQPVYGHRPVPAAVLNYVINEPWQETLRSHQRVGKRGSAPVAGPSRPSTQGRARGGASTPSRPSTQARARGQAADAVGQEKVPAIRKFSPQPPDIEFEERDESMSEEEHTMTESTETEQSDRNTAPCNGPVAPNERRTSGGSTAGGRAKLSYEPLDKGRGGEGRGGAASPTDVELPVQSGHYRVQDPVRVQNGNRKNSSDNENSGSDGAPEKYFVPQSASPSGPSNAASFPESEGRLLFTEWRALQREALDGRHEAPAAQLTEAPSGAAATPREQLCLSFSSEEIALPPSHEIRPEKVKRKSNKTALARAQKWRQDTSSEASSQEALKEPPPGSRAAAEEHLDDAREIRAAKVVASRKKSRGSSTRSDKSRQQPLRDPSPPTAPPPPPRAPPVTILVAGNRATVPNTDPAYLTTDLTTPPLCASTAGRAPKEGRKTAGEQSSGVGGGREVPRLEIGEGGGSGLSDTAGSESHSSAPAKRGERRDEKNSSADGGVREGSVPSDKQSKNIPNMNYSANNKLQQINVIENQKLKHAGNESTEDSDNDTSFGMKAKTSQSKLNHAQNNVTLERTRSGKSCKEVHSLNVEMPRRTDETPHSPTRKTMVSTPHLGAPTDASGHSSPRDTPRAGHSPPHRSAPSDHKNDHSLHKRQVKTSPSDALRVERKSSRSRAATVGSHAGGRNRLEVVRDPVGPARGRAESLRHPMKDVKNEGARDRAASMKDRYDVTERSMKKDLKRWPTRGESVELTASGSNGVRSSESDENFAELNEGSMTQGVGKRGSKVSQRIEVEASRKSLSRRDKGKNANDPQEESTLERGRVLQMPAEVQQKEVNKKQRRGRASSLRASQSRRVGDNRTNSIPGEQMLTGPFNEVNIDVEIEKKEAEAHQLGDKVDGNAPAGSSARKTRQNLPRDETKSRGASERGLVARTSSGKGKTAEAGKKQDLSDVEDEEPINRKSGSSRPVAASASHKNFSDAEPNGHLNEDETSASDSDSEQTDTSSEEKAKSFKSKVINFFKKLKKESESDTESGSEEESSSEEEDPQLLQRSKSMSHVEMKSNLMSKEVPPPSQLEMDLAKSAIQVRDLVTRVRSTSLSRGNSRGEEVSSLSENRSKMKKSSRYRSVEKFFGLRRDESSEPSTEDDNSANSDEDSDGGTSDDSASGAEHEKNLEKPTDRYASPARVLHSENKAHADLAATQSDASESFDSSSPRPMKRLGSLRNLWSKLKGKSKKRESTSSDYSGSDSEEGSSEDASGEIDKNAISAAEPKKKQQKPSATSLVALPADEGRDEEFHEDEEPIRTKSPSEFVSATSAPSLLDQHDSQGKPGFHCGSYRPQSQRATRSTSEESLPIESDLDRPLRGAPHGSRSEDEENLYSFESELDERTVDAKNSEVPLLSTRDESTRNSLTSNATSNKEVLRTDSPRPEVSGEQKASGNVLLQSSEAEGKKTSPPHDPIVSDDRTASQKLSIESHHEALSPLYSPSDETSKPTNEKIPLPVRQTEGELGRSMNTERPGERNCPSTFNRASAPSSEGDVKPSFDERVEHRGSVVQSKNSSERGGLNQKWSGDETQRTPLTQSTAASRARTDSLKSGAPAAASPAGMPCGTPTAGTPRSRDPEEQYDGDDESGSEDSFHFTETPQRPGDTGRNLLRADVDQKEHNKVLGSTTRKVEPESVSDQKQEKNSSEDFSQKDARSSNSLKGSSDKFSASAAGVDFTSRNSFLDAAQGEPSAARVVSAAPDEEANGSKFAGGVGPSENSPEKFETGTDQEFASTPSRNSDHSARSQSEQSDASFESEDEDLEKLTLRLEIEDVSRNIRNISAEVGKFKTHLEKTYFAEDHSIHDVEVYDADEEMIVTSIGVPTGVQRTRDELDRRINFLEFINSNQSEKESSQGSSDGEVTRKFEELYEEVTDDRTASSVHRKFSNSSEKKTYKIIEDLSWRDTQDIDAAKRDAAKLGQDLSWKERNFDTQNTDAAKRDTARSGQSLGLKQKRPPGESRAPKALVGSRSALRARDPSPTYWNYSLKLTKSRSRGSSPSGRAAHSISPDAGQHDTSFSSLSSSRQDGSRSRFRLVPLLPSKKSPLPAGRNSNTDRNSIATEPLAVNPERGNTLRKANASSTELNPGKTLVSDKSSSHSNESSESAQSKSEEKTRNSTSSPPGHVSGGDMSSEPPNDTPRPGVVATNKFTLADQGNRPAKGFLLSQVLGAASTPRKAALKSPKNSEERTTSSRADNVSSLPRSCDLNASSKSSGSKQESTKKNDVPGAKMSGVTDEESEVNVSNIIKSKDEKVKIGENFRENTSNVSSRLPETVLPVGKIERIVDQAGQSHLEKETLFVARDMRSWEPAFSATAPTDPSPTGPSPTGPSATGPSPTGPSPTGPSPTGPSPTGPSPTGPSPTGPSPTGPSPTGPSPTGPSPTGPSPTGPSPTGPSPTGPSPTSGPTSPTQSIATQRTSNTGPGHLNERPVDQIISSLREESANSWSAGESKENLLPGKAEDKTTLVASGAVNFTQEISNETLELLRKIEQQQRMLLAQQRKLSIESSPAAPTPRPSYGAEGGSHDERPSTPTFSQLQPTNKSLSDLIASTFEVSESCPDGGEPKVRERSTKHVATPLKSGTKSSLETSPTSGLAMLKPNTASLSLASSPSNFGESPTLGRKFRALGSESPERLKSELPKTSMRTRSTYASPYEGLRPHLQRQPKDYRAPMKSSELLAKHFASLNKEKDISPPTTSAPSTGPSVAAFAGLDAAVTTTGVTAAGNSSVGAQSLVPVNNRGEAFITGLLATGAGGVNSAKAPLPAASAASNSEETRSNIRVDGEVKDRRIKTTLEDSYLMPNPAVTKETRSNFRVDGDVKDRRIENRIADNSTPSAHTKPIMKSRSSQQQPLARPAQTSKESLKSVHWETSMPSSSSSSPSPTPPLSPTTFSGRYGRDPSIVSVRTVTIQRLVPQKVVLSPTSPAGGRPLEEVSDDSKSPPPLPASSPPPLSASSPPPLSFTRHFQ